MVMSKTNAVRIIEKLNVEHEVFEYETDEEKIDALSVAEKLGVSPEIVFKTLVARNEVNEVLVFVIPGNHELNLKKAASSSGSKKVELINQKDLLSLTGYIRGGCSPIGMKKIYPTFLDESSELFENIFVSSGKRGAQIKIEPKVLVEIINAKKIDLI